MHKESRKEKGQSSRATGQMHMDLGWKQKGAYGDVGLEPLEFEVTSVEAEVANHEQYLDGR